MVGVVEAEEMAIAAGMVLGVAETVRKSEVVVISTGAMAEEKGITEEVAMAVDIEMAAVVITLVDLVGGVVSVNVVDIAAAVYVATAVDAGESERFSMGYCIWWAMKLSSGGGVTITRGHISKRSSIGGRAIVLRSGVGVTVTLGHIGKRSFLKGSPRRAIKLSVGGVIATLGHVGE